MSFLHPELKSIIFLILTAAITGLVVLIGLAPASFSTPLAIAAAVLFAGSLIMGYFQLIVSLRLNIYMILGLVFSMINIVSLASFVMMLNAKTV
ncbi:hypothetical protein JMA_32250 [Jeotgalibacillus malaysiensis]|uniref:Uncharacterized protein n=1 Tax=Jeotgalibacillus malaysiensis TaxID=1508404 RepID=A0A0B5AUX3_9BACL|nr:hypothetical protein [Jeotgalibacillus malaysiensis]AJD92542.1 hypothetical protein JMA_32250 [Jeotgalibacillus malaysiensis]